MRTYYLLSAIALFLQYSCIDKKEQQENIIAKPNVIIVITDDQGYVEAIRL